MTTATDARRHDFVILDNEAVDDYDLTPQEGWLYVIIIRHINHQQGIAFPSLATLAKKTRMSKPTVVKCLKSLEAKKLIKIEQQKGTDTNDYKPNHYTALAVPKKRKVVNEVDNVVKEIDKGGQPDLQGVVKEVDSNKIEIEKDRAKKINTAAPAAQDSEAQKSSKPKTQRQLMFEAICSAFGYDWKNITKTKRGQVNKAISELLEAKATLADIPGLVRYAIHRSEKSGPMALASSWDDYKALPKRGKPTVSVTPIPEDEINQYVPGSV
jgi:DNA-binding transcriptional regulator YhcF (GntR family)